MTYKKSTIFTLVFGGQLRAVYPQSATKILNMMTRVFRLDHIETICRILNCTPNDLLRWSPDNDNTIPESHSLTKLKREQNSYQLQESLKTLSFEQLNQIATLINQQKADK